MILFLLISNIFAGDEEEASPSPHARGVSFYRNQLDQQHQVLTLEEIRRLQLLNAQKAVSDATTPLVTELEQQKDELARARASRERYAHNAEEQREILSRELIELKEKNVALDRNIDSLQQEMDEKIRLLGEEKETACKLLREKFETEKQKLTGENQEELKALTEKMDQELARLEQEKQKKEEQVIALTGDVSRFAAAAYAMHAQGHALFEEVKKLYQENSGFREVMGTEPSQETYLEALSKVASFVSLSSKEINEKFPRLRELSKHGLTKLFPRK